MKKFILALALAVSSVGALSAQVKGKAIGGRFGYDAFEVSYQHPLGNANRLELGLGYNTLGYFNGGSAGPTLSGVYQWVNDLSSITDGLNWYWGLGASVAIGTNYYNDYGVNYSNTYFGIGALGQVGVEYNFDFPLQLSIDCRPGVYLFPAHSAYPINISGFSPCVAVRYRF